MFLCWWMGEIEFKRKSVDECRQQFFDDNGKACWP